MSEAGDRRLPNARLRRFMLAVQEVTGQSGLTTILRQAGLPRYAGALPPENGQAVITASEYASLMQAIENYYGRGARGTLNRIGHEAFNRLLASQPATAAAFQLLCSLLPRRVRQQIVLGWVAREMAAPGGRADLERAGSRWVLVDPDSDSTAGRTRDIEICWATAGEIQAAVHWATGREHEVTEVSCKAKGAPACRFEIGDELS